MQKKLVSLALAATVLATVSLGAYADRDKRGQHWDRWEQPAHWDRRDTRSRHWRGSRHRQWRGDWHFSPHRFRPHRFQNDRRWRNNRHWRGKRHWRNHRHWGRRDNRHWGWSANALSGAVLGSAITYGVLNDRNDERHRDHSYVEQYPVPTGQNEITACFRMERLPDGREQRVELPAADCR